MNVCMYPYMYIHAVPMNTCMYVQAANKIWADLNMIYVDTLLHICLSQYVYLLSQQSTLFVYYNNDCCVLTGVPIILTLL